MNNFNLRILCFDNPNEARVFNEKYVKSDEYGADHMSKKLGYLNIFAENLRDPACHILKQTMLSVGGDVAIHRDVLLNQGGHTSAMIMATRVQLRTAVKKLKLQMFGLPILADELTELLNAPLPRSLRKMSYNGGELVFGEKTLIMGILNCTPDSFSDGGQWFDTDKAVEHALAMQRDGADIIDIGGESTRPGSAEVSLDEEISRVVPVIEALKGKLKIPISIDSYKAATAKAALKAGAHIINDVWGFQRDPDMPKVAAEFQCPVILMHNKTEAQYDNFISELMAFLRKSIDIGVNAGCDKNQIIVDPGFGFGKDMEHNLLITKKLKELSVMGCPVLMAASRKKTVGLVLDAPVDKRLFGDGAITAQSIVNGADIIRVHDVKEMSQVAKMVDATLKAQY
ncbi:MAG: dihydropteroate synthase [Clostridiales bacterium]